MPNMENLLPRQNPDIGILLLRIFVGCRLFYGVIDNVLSWDKMIEFSEFLAAYRFPMPLFCAFTSVYVQLVGSILILIGCQLRMASAILVFNFLIALIGVHFVAQDSVEVMTPALAMLFGCLTLYFTSSGHLSIDHNLKKRAHS